MQPQQSVTKRWEAVKTEGASGASFSRPSNKRRGRRYGEAPHYTSNLVFSVSAAALLATVRLCVRLRSKPEMRNGRRTDRKTGERGRQPGDRRADGAGSGAKWIIDYCNCCSSHSLSLLASAAIQMGEGEGEGDQRSRRSDPLSVQRELELN